MRQKSKFHRVSKELQRGLEIVVEYKECDHRRQNDSNTRQASVCLHAQPFPEHRELLHQEEKHVPGAD